MCSTNNIGHKRHCFVCDQKRPIQWFKPTFKFKIDSRKWIAFEEKFHAKLVGVCKEFFFSLLTLMCIFLTVLVILRGTAGELPEVLNTLALLWENGKEKITDFVPDSAKFLWDRLALPFVQVKDNFLYCVDGIGGHFKALGENFLELFPYIGQNFQALGKGIAFVTVELWDKIKVLFGNLGRIIARIAESIEQFVERIGA